MWLRNRSLIAVGVRAEDPPVMLNGVASVTLPVLKYINSFCYPAQQEHRHPTDCQISDTHLIEWSPNPLHMWLRMHAHMHAHTHKYSVNPNPHSAVNSLLV